jgi:transposase-like protein
MVQELGNLVKVARNLDITEGSLRNWVKQHDIDDGCVHAAADSRPAAGTEGKDAFRHSFVDLPGSAVLPEP